MSFSIVAPPPIVDREINLRREQASTQGIEVANALARVPLDRGVPTAGELGPLPVLRATQSQSFIAYAAVVDLSTYRSPNTRIRFLTSPDLGNNLGNSDVLYDDDIEICLE